MSEFKEEQIDGSGKEMRLNNVEEMIRQSYEDEMRDMELFNDLMNDLDDEEQDTRQERDNLMRARNYQEENMNEMECLYNDLTGEDLGSIVRQGSSSSSHINFVDGLRRGIGYEMDEIDRYEDIYDNIRYRNYRDRFPRIITNSIQTAILLGLLLNLRRGRF